MGMTGPLPSPPNPLRPDYIERDSSIVIDMSERDLARVERATERVVAARIELNAAIREAYAQGETLRSIARAADISFQRVHQIVRGYRHNPSR